MGQGGPANLQIPYKFLTNSLQATHCAKRAFVLFFGVGANGALPARPGSGRPLPRSPCAPSWSVPPSPCIVAASCPNSSACSSLASMARRADPLGPQWALFRPGGTSARPAHTTPYRRHTMSTQNAPATRVLPTDAQLLALAQSSPRHLPVLRVTARTADGKRYARVVVECGCGAEREVASQDLFQVRGCYSCQTRSARKARKTRRSARIGDLQARIAELEAQIEGQDDGE